jgi:outer membrane protein TolC
MKTLAAALAALALGISPARAQTAAPAAAPAQPAALTLEEALRRADDANLDLKAARAKVEQARAGVQKAWSYYLPQVTAGASWTHNSDASSISLPTGYAVRQRNGGPNEPQDPGGLPGDPTPYFIAPTGMITADLQKLDQLGGQVQVTQALIAPPLWFAIQGAYRGLDVAERSVENARQELLFGVAQTYYGVTSLKKLLDVSERLLEIAQRQEKDAEVRYKAGTIAKVGFLRAEIDRARAEQDLRRARNGYESARISLATLLDRDLAFEVVEPPPPPPPPAGVDLQQTALTQRRDVQAARASEALAGSLRSVSAARYLPSLGAFGRWQVSNVGGFTGKSDSWAVGLALNWTLFDGGLREGELRDGSAKIVEAEATRRSAERRAMAEVAQAQLDLESALANALKSKEQSELAAENQRLVDVSFRAGAATAVEQADATAALRNALIAVTTDELQAQLAALRVLKVAGIFEPVAAGK